MIPSSFSQLKMNSEGRISFENKEGLDFLKSIDNNSINLILTDPPYMISKETGMNTFRDSIKKNESEAKAKHPERNDPCLQQAHTGSAFFPGTGMKTEKEWEQYKRSKGITTDEKKDLYQKYGSIYGKKYSVQTKYGDWDENFSLDLLDTFICEYYKKLKKGGTLIIFFDIWKITPLHQMLSSHKFKQIRYIEWIKTNPQPLNSNLNYLSNCREIALLGVKGSKPTFHSSYDKGIYEFPIQGGKERFHPTQKPLSLFEELIKKHSNEGDIVLDTFAGSGTTAVACKKTNREFKGCEVSESYYQKALQRIRNTSPWKKW